MDATWHDRSVDDTLAELRTQTEGLTSDEAQRRLEQHGPNLLQSQQSESAWHVLLRQFKSVVVIVMVAAFLLAAVTQHWPETIALAAVIIFNTAIGFFTEWRAQRSMEALRELGDYETTVRRDNQQTELPAAQLVPGDIILIEAPFLLPADARLISGENIRAEEAALTGESVPVSKDTQPLDADTPLAERTNMLYKGTNVADGQGVAVVVATGMDTEVGRISELTAEAEGVATPLQKRLDRLGHKMAWAVAIIAVLVAVVGLLANRDFTLMLETAIALGVAAIPEGLPIVATIALARGMWLMAQRNALINRLPAVETLGATNVIFTDKTGTLTENRMVVKQFSTARGTTEFERDAADDASDIGAALRRALEVSVLCNGARLDSENDSDSDEQPAAGSGDPMEVALLQAGRARGLSQDDLLEAQPLIRTVEFARETMMMATFHESEHGVRIAVKGAPQNVIDVCQSVATEDGADDLDDQRRDAWRQRVKEMAASGLRPLAMAERYVDSKDAEPYEDLTLLGLVGLFDPPREPVRAAIDECQKAGVSVVMVTGDQPETAYAVGEAVGIFGGPDDPEARVVHGSELAELDELSDEQRQEIHQANIFARVTPEQKLNLISVYQDFGDRVAMTGDGVNDTPALKKADIGIAMGQRGTDAAKQVADMVLRDDSFGSIVKAIEQGRIIFGNIRAAVMFMLCTNGAEVLAVAVASFLGVPLPLRPLQILYLNMLTDVFPALALASGKGPSGIMDRKPRDPNESVLRSDHWWAVGGWSVLIAGCVLTALALGVQWLGLPEQAAITISFLTIALAKLWFVFNLRDRHSGVFRNEVSTNLWIWGAILFCAALVVAAVYLPGLSDVLDTQHPGWSGWAVALCLSFVPAVVGQIVLLFLSRRRPRSEA
jgi:Ca2+-transporting ATPase